MEQTFFKFDEKILKASEKALERAEHSFARIEKNTEYNQQKVLAAFIENRVSESHFTETTGYGYGDRGRETLDNVFASAFGAEAALVRHSFACGTHTLGVALFGLLRPGDTMLSVTIQVARAAQAGQRKTNANPASCSSGNRESRMLLQRGDVNSWGQFLLRSSICRRDS